MSLEGETGVAHTPPGRLDGIRGAQGTAAAASIGYLHIHSSTTLSHALQKGPTIARSELETPLDISP